LAQSSTSDRGYANECDGWDRFDSEECLGLLNVVASSSHATDGFCHMLPSL